MKGKAAPSRARKVVRTGDIILATTRPNLNAVAQVPPALNNQICSTGFCVLRPTPEIDSDFLFFFVQSGTFIEALSELVVGALYPAVKDSQVFNQEIDLPSITEQQRIANALKNKDLASVMLDDGEREKFRLDSQDILISRVNSFEHIGKSGIVSDAEAGYFFENMLIRLRFVPEVDPLFMVQQLATRSVRAAMQDVAKRAIGQVSINSSDLRNLKVRLPDIKRQEEIALSLNASIDSVTSLRTLVADELSGFNDIPSVLLRQAFSGAL